jgi:sugar/nucleoside kinase (ribokinase family)
VTPQQAEPTPQPPTPQVQSKGDDALTAREGPGAGNYGLRTGDGSGSRIGGKVGGDPFGAYAQLILAEVRRETQNDPQLTNLDYTARFRVTLNASGEVVDAVSLDAGLDRKLEAILRARLLKIKLSTPPPSGLPPVKIEISSRSQF